MAADEMWFICRPSIDYNIVALRPGMLIPCRHPAEIICMPVSDPPWESVRALLEDAEWV